MANQMNRFAALSPDYDEEEDKRKKAADQKAKREAEKAKKDEKVKAKTEVHTEAQGFEVSEDARPPQRGRGRGVGRAIRGNRGGEEHPQEKFAPQEGKKGLKDYHFTGSNDPIHPFDKKSGTGRGKEVPKQGGGKGNWGTVEDDLKYQNREEEEKQGVEAEAEVVPKEEEKKEGEAEKGQHLSKKEKKKRKKQKIPEEKKQENLDADGTAMTYKEYLASIADKQKNVPSKKAEEQMPKIDPKKAEGLVAYEKPQYKQTSETEQKSDKKKEETNAEEPQKDILGTFIGEEKRGKRGRGQAYRGRGAEQKELVQEENKREGIAEVHPAKEEPKKVEKAAFVMKDEDFPTFK